MDDDLFIETARKLWDACGDLPSWKSGYTERLAKNLMAMMCEPAKYSGYNDTTAQAAFMNYAMRKRMLVIGGTIQMN